MRVGGDCKIYGQNASCSLLLAGLFAFFMYPISYFGLGDGISVNYSFLIMPIISIAFYGYDFKSINKIVVIHFVSYVLIFAASFLFRQNDHKEWMGRQILSFVAFMSFFGIYFVDRRFISISAFKAGVIAVSVILSFTAIYKYIFICQIHEICSGLKGELGSQRYGFLYILAIWILAYSNATSIFERFIRYGLAAIIVIGLALTYSRSSVLALVVTIVCFLFIRSSNGRLGNYGKAASAGALILYVGVIFVITACALESVRDVYFGSGVPTNIAEEVTNENASVGYRVMVWRDILNYTQQNPMVGSGFKGVWTLYAGMSGSAHSQYFDVFFRAGIIGFAIYVSILYAIAMKLWRLGEGLFFGFIGILVIGIFHETFRLSQGAFVLSFLYVIAMGDKPVANGLEGSKYV